MKNKIIGLFILGIFILGVGFASALTYDDSEGSDSMLIKVDVMQSTVSISVPDNLIIENMALGYLSEMQGFDIVNSGTTDIQVIPELSDSTNSELFSNLAFRRIQLDELVKIGFFDVEIEKPKSVGETRAQNIYAQLDLTEYDGDYTEGENNATVIFTAVPL